MAMLTIPRGSIFRLQSAEINEAHAMAVLNQLLNLGRHLALGLQHLSTPGSLLRSYAASNEAIRADLARRWGGISHLKTEFRSSAVAILHERDTESCLPFLKDSNKQVLQ